MRRSRSVRGMKEGRKRGVPSPTERTEIRRINERKRKVEREENEERKLNEKESRSWNHFCSCSNSVLL